MCGDWIKNKHKETHARAQMPLSISCCQLRLAYFLPAHPSFEVCSVAQSYIYIMQGKKYLLSLVSTL